MSNRALIALLMCTSMSFSQLSCRPVKRGVELVDSVYHTSMNRNTVVVGSVLLGMVGELLPGLFKPMRWFRLWQQDARVMAGGSPRTVRIAVLSDMNGSYGSTTYKEPVHDAVEALIDTFEPALVISTGDMVAGMKHGLDYQAMWDAFHRAVTLPLRRAGIAYAPTPGNHDGTNYPGFALEREVYRSTWEAHMPDLEYVDSDYYPRRYAFLFEGILFVSIDASTVGRISAKQRKWLEGVLEAHAEVPAKVVYGHVPLYPFARGREAEVLGDEALEELLVEHGVSAYLSGHHHAYYPGRRETGIKLVSMACLGGGPRRLMGRDEPSPRALAILEIDPEAGAIEVEGYMASDFASVIDRASLPASIGEGAWRIVRDDL